MRRIVATLLLLFVAATSVAAPFTAYFDAVHDKLVAMRDAFVPPLTKAQAKRKALVVKVIAAIDKVSASLAGDAATARTVAAAAFGTLKDDPELPGLVKDLLVKLEGDVVARVAALSTRIDALPDGKSKTAAAKKLATTRTSLDAFDAAAAKPDLKAMAAALVKAVIGCEALEKLVSKAEAVALGCSPIAKTGGKVTIATTGYPSDVLQKTTAIQSSGLPGHTVLLMSRLDPTGLYRSLGVSIELDPKGIHLGDTPTARITFAFGVFASPQIYVADVPIRVVEESAKRVAFCIDATLPAQVGGSIPAEFTVRGYVVLSR